MVASGMKRYRFKMAVGGLRRLATMPEEDKQACIDAYKFFQRMQDGNEKGCSSTWFPMTF